MEIKTANVAMIRNPVLTGSHPDPSIVRVGPDYYVATSTFEWYPGVRLHHSRDLVSWRPLGGALTDTSLLDLAGCPDSAGVWAPNLSYADGLFYLVYSNVSTYEAGFADCPTYVITAETIEGPWSAPELLHARGFDASLFHDGEHSWLVNLIHDWRPGSGSSAGLEATRYDRYTRRLIGDPVMLDLPSADAWIEGPNLYRRGAWFYLVTADGGTGYDHQVTVARSRELAGPYERDPNGPLITARHRPELALQKAGHGSLVQTPTGPWYLAYLVARPHGTHGPCILGRETALALVDWTDDDWPRVPDGLPTLTVPGPDSESESASEPTTGSASADDQEAASESDNVAGGDQRDNVAGGDQLDTFDEPTLGPQWSTLRRPASSTWLSLTERPSHLRVRGGRSPQSLVDPSLVARRVSAAHCTFEATMDYQPRQFQHVAGITAYYNVRNWHFFYLTADNAGLPALGLATRDRGVLTLHNVPAVGVADTSRVRLGVDIDGPELAFRYHDATGWQSFGPALDTTILSDEHAIEVDQDQVRIMGFTGAFVGLWVWDLNGHGHPADFDETRYLARATNNGYRG